MWKSIIELNFLGYSNKQIKEKLNLTSRQILNCLERNNIKSNKYDKLDETIVAPIVEALILGDGHLTSISGLSKSSRYSVAHCVEQKEYLEWKHSLLDRFDLAGNIKYNKIINRRYKKGYVEEYRFKSKSHSIFTKYRNYFYPFGVKIIPKDLKITPLLLAILFMDDGTKGMDGYYLCTHGFDKDSVITLKTLLENTYNLDLSIHNNNQIYIPKKEVKKFNLIIEPYIIDCMKYKLHLGPV